MALSVEMFGANKLEGLSKKDQKARERARLGLQPERDHKRPYKQLVELRNKQRTQDEAAAALAKETGMTGRKQSAELTVEGPKRDKWGEGVILKGGMLHVDTKQIRNVRFHAGKGEGGGKGRGKATSRQGSSPCSGRAAEGRRKILWSYLGTTSL